MVRKRIGVLVLLLGVFALAAGSLTHIRPGDRGASARGWLEPGWGLRVPFSKTVRVLDKGELSTGPVEITTPAGASRKYELRLRYTLTARGDDPKLAAATRTEGALDKALTGLLADLMAPVVRSPAAPPARSGSAADPLGAAIAAGLSKWGVSVESLTWRRIDATSAPSITARPASQKRRLLMVGLDGADWQIIDPLMARGRLPNLSRLIREGVRAPLRSYDPMISPLIWTTMVTGVGPDVHGVADFLVSEHSSGAQVPITSRFRRVKALWNILSDSGLSSAFIGWWASYPAEAVRGFQVSDLMGFSLMKATGTTPSSAPGMTYPESYYSDIRPRLIVPDAVTLAEVNRFVRASPADDARSRDPKARAPAEGGRAAVQNPLWLVRRALAITRNYETIALDLLGKDLDTVGVYFEGIDLMGHRFQHCIPPKMEQCSATDFANWKDAVTAFYEYQDDVVGRLVAAAPGRTVMVVSDHGFRSGPDRPPDILPYTTGQPVEWHREYGIFILSGPGARRGAVLEKASVYDVMPTLLYLSGLPAAADMSGHVLEGALDPADLAKQSPRTIPSYEDVGPARVLAEAKASPDAQKEMVENLQALGYVGAVPDGSDHPSGEPSAAPGIKRDTRSASPAPTSDGPDTEGTRVAYHRNLATFFMKSGRFDEAESQLRAANAVKPLPKSFELLSEIRAARGDVDGAIAELEEGLRQFPEMEPEAVLWMIDLRLGEGRPDLASQIFSKWRGRLTRPALLATCEGKLEAARGNDAHAIELLTAALREEPSLSQAALAVAPILDARGRLAELEAPVTRALASEKRLDEYQNLLGVIRLQQGRPMEALEAIGRALDVDPVNARFLENYSTAANAGRKPALALERYSTAVRESSAGPAVWAGYGRLLGVLHRPRDAEAAFAKASALGDRSAETYLGYAASLLETGQRDRSRAVVQEGLRLYPDDVNLKNLARTVG